MRQASLPRSEAGFTLVEIMVAMVIALVATIVIFQTFAVSEGIKRTSTSGGDAQQNGALALYSMARELRMAGFGMNNPGLLGCTVKAYDATHVPPDIPDFQLAPVVIQPGAAATDPDSLTIMFGDSDLLSNPATLTSDMPSSTAVYRVSNRYGYAPGDVVIVVDPDDPAKGCTMAEITQTPGTPGQTDVLVHNPGSYVNAEGQSVDSRFNKAGGLGVPFENGDMVFNLGQLPTQHLYRIVNNQLVLESTFGPVPSLVMADNVVHLRAEYGKDDGVDNGTVPAGPKVADDGIVDNYVNTMPAAPTAKDWGRILAVRVAVVARSTLAEKPSVEGGPCDTTTAAPTWAGGAFDLTADPNWNCYRYRAFETTVPLRNLIWQQL
jgi:type IV pilus assembly protein PilW